MSRDRDRELAGLLEGLPDDVVDRLRRLFHDGPLLAMRSSLVGGAAGRRLTLGKLTTGLWRVRGLCAEELKLDFRAEGVALEHSKLELHLDVELGFSLPSLRSAKPKVYRAGPAPGRVSTPTLPRLDLSFLTKGVGLGFILSSVCADDATADVAPIGPIDAGDGGLRMGEAAPVRAPLGSVVGASLRGGRAALDHLRLERIETPSVRVERLGAEGDVILRDVEVRGAKVPKASVGRVAGGELDLDFEVSLPRMKIKSFPDLPKAIERLSTRVWVEIAPKLVVHIGNLAFEGLTIAADVGALRLDELRLGFDIANVSVEEVTLEGVEVDGLEVADEP